jgi:hypothetical protein
MLASTRRPTGRVRRTCRVEIGAPPARTRKLPGPAVAHRARNDLAARSCLSWTNHDDGHARNTDRSADEIPRGRTVDEPGPDNSYADVDTSVCGIYAPAEVG